MTEKLTDVLQERIDRTLQESDEPPDWLSRLVRYWHNERATVITLNYDTLVERVPNRDVKYIYPLRPVEAGTGETVPGHLAGV